MQDVCARDNLKEALRQVKANKRSAGVDRMTVDQVNDYSAVPENSVRIEISGVIDVESIFHREKPIDTDFSEMKPQVEI